MTNYVKKSNLQVAPVLYEFITKEALPESGLDQETFWSEFSQLVHDLTPKNKELLAKREELQKTINKWHFDNKDLDAATYKSFLEEIGYLEPESEDFHVTSENVDNEVAIQSVRLPGDFHPDPADRMITALSRHYSAPLVTNDSKIQNYKYVKTIW